MILKTGGPLAGLLNINSFSSFDLGVTTVFLLLELIGFDLDFPSFVFKGIYHYFSLACPGKLKQMEGFGWAFRLCSEFPPKTRHFVQPRCDAQRSPIFGTHKIMFLSVGASTWFYGVRRGDEN